MVTLRTGLQGVAVESKLWASPDPLTVTPGHGGSWGCSGTGRAAHGWMSRGLVEVWICPCACVRARISLSPSSRSRMCTHA